MDWYDTAAIDEVIWSVVINVNGGTRENPELKDTVKNFSTVLFLQLMVILNQVYTKYLFYWSANQILPENLAIMSG